MIPTPNGKRPANPMGSCFESVGFALVSPLINELIAVKVCHGIGVSNIPGETPELISHAWIEATSLKHGHVALDAIWMVAQPVALYRRNLKVSLVKEYTREEFMKKWAETDYPGPWEDCLFTLTKEGKNGTS